MKTRIMSSNVWGNCPADRPLADRDDKIAKVYFRYLPDAIGLQECSKKLREERPNLFALVRDLYEEVPVMPTNEEQNNFTPIVYRKDRLAVEDSGWLCFEGLNDHGSKSITWALFFHKESGSRFIHMNMHYFWTQDEAGREARVSNTKEMLALCEKLTAEYHCPFVLTGDFNCCTDEPPIQSVLASGFREARLCSEAPVAALRSYHEYPEIDDSDPANITYPVGHMPDGRIEKSIDHIFVNGGIAVQRYETVVDEEALQATDHCPIFADLIFE